MTIGIYKITNNKNGKFYIGSSINIEQRLKGHFRLLRTGKHINKKLQNSFNFHGESFFISEIIKVCKNK